MRSIRHRVLFALIAAALLPSSLILWVTNDSSGEALESAQYEKVQGVGSEIARQVANSMEASRSHMKSLESNPVIADPDASMDRRVAEMDRLVNIYHRFSDITIYDPKGNQLKSTSKRAHSQAVGHTRWFKDASERGEVTISRPHKEVGLPGLHTKVFVPVKVTGSEKPHVVKARVSFGSVWDRMEGARLGEAGRIVLLDSSGNILFQKDKTKILEKFDPKFPAKKWGEISKGIYKDSTGEAFIYAATSIGEDQTHVGEKWILVSFLPQSEVTSEVKKSQDIQMLLGLITLLIALVVGYWFSKGLSDPLIRTSDLAQQVANGNLSERLPDTGSLEIRKLSSSFNVMVDQVREHRDKLSSLVDRRTEKLRASEAIQKQTSAMLLASYEATQEGVLVVGPDGKVVAANRQLGHFFGFDSSNVPGAPVSQLEDPMFKCFADPGSFGSEWKKLRKDPHAYVEDRWELTEPEPRSLLIYSSPVADQEGVFCARLWMFRDVTEQERLQEGLQQAQKMEAVGRLAGGVAHDFNNLLVGIIGNLSLAELGGSDNGETPEQLMASAKRAGERAAELVKQLLGFSRRTHLKFRIADCNEVLRDVEGLIVHTFDPRITIEVDTAAQLWGAKVDPNQIEQVVMNMCVNAKDAMPDSGGKISVTSENVTLEARHLSENVSAQPGEYVALTVADDGDGMPPEVLQKVYEPFFTTKEQGKGTGLGLATSYGIIRQHGGWIDCTSKVGEGTVFTIYLPKAAESGTVSVADSRKKPDTKIERGDETILLVDDEDVVRNVAESVLKHHGYSTVTASDGLEALDIFEKGEHDIDLILLDLTMPNLSGADTFKRVRAEYGDVPVIVCSGYAVNLDEFGAENGARPNGFVQKPYNIADLATQVRVILNEACLSA